MNSRPDCCYRLGIVVFAILPLSALSCVARAATSTLTLVRDGQPAATIVVAQSAGHIPWFAAGELQYHVRKITGATLPIVANDAEVRGTRILVGASRQTESMGFRNGDFKPQEYLIGFRPDALLLLGRDRENDSFPVHVTGPLSRVEGKYGKALEFTGTQAVSVSAHGFSDEAGTLEAWVWLGDERPDAGTIFRLDGDPWTYHIVDVQGGGLRYVVYDGKSGRSVASTKLANGWHHLCASHDGRAGKIELFVDGASCGTAAYAATSCSNAPALLIGGFPADGKLANAFRGRVDEVRLARAAHPPAADWATQLRASDTNTLVRLSFDEPVGPPRELSGRLRATGPPSLDEAMTPQATCYAVYDFLERFCDVRWYAPTELGMVFPTRATLEVGGADIRRTPTFEFRHHAPSGVGKAYVGLSAPPTDEEQRLFVARRRLGGKNFMTNHSFYDFYDRFWGLDPTKPGDKIGPEFTFGLTMDAALAEPVLIIKAAWGGKSLHTDFRSPSAGPYQLSSFQRENYPKQTGHGIPRNFEQWKADKAKSTGHYYRLMIGHVKKVLDDVKRVYPGYDAAQGYELAGFVWLQGFNDMVDGHVYPNHNKPDRFDLYSEVLAHFIRDVRKDLAAPHLPFVIGVMGVGGLKDESVDMVAFRRAMAAPEAMPEFKGNVVAVQTAPFWSDELGAIDKKHEKVRQMRYFLDSKHKDHANADGKMTEEQKREFVKKFEADLITPAEVALWKRGASNAGYHYLGCGKTFALVGTAFAQATLAMMKRQ